MTFNERFDAILTPNIISRCSFYTKVFKFCFHWIIDKTIVFEPLEKIIAVFFLIYLIPSLHSLGWFEG